MKYAQPVIKKDQPCDDHKFLPLPKPSGSYPYHLRLSDIIADTPADTLTFHMAGDTGSVRGAGSQKYVADAITAQYLSAGVPGFLYHLGDVVYHFGEASHYSDQFFKPFEGYPGPIFAIAGNHDSDVNPDTAAYKSLNAFTQVFCDIAPKKIAFSGGSTRQSMTQPNIYWTLQTSLATIIGLHSNVPKYGIITDEQRDWLIAELKAADPDKILIVCVHHAPYSADTNHGSSLYMINFLEGVYAAAGIRPDIVFSGHVHNYQRFSKKNLDGTISPYIIAGAGGFDELHQIADIADHRFTANHPLFEDVILEKYGDTQHGFLKISISRKDNGLTLNSSYYTIDTQTTDAVPADTFTLHKRLTGTKE